MIAVAAEALEFGGLLRRAGRVQRLGWPLEFAREAEIGGRRWILAAHGPGPALARHAAKTALERCGSGILLSTGFCGGTREGLQTGEIFAACEVVDAATGVRYPALPVAAGGAFRQGTLWSQDRVAVTPEEKAEIAARGADAVEMEASGVAAEAAARRIPFHCVRVVTDGAGDPLPLDFNRLRGAEGRFSRWGITAAVLVHPSRLMPLLRFHQACRRAAEQLGEFLVHCRF